MASELNGSLEENVLTGLCWNTELSAHLLLCIQPSMFSTTENREIAKRAFNYIEKYSAPPAAHMYDIFEHELRRVDASAKLLKRRLAEMEHLSPHLQASYVIERLDTFIQLAQLRQAVDKANEALFNEDVEGAKMALVQQELQPNFDTGIWLHKPEEVLSFLNVSEDDFFPSGIAELDSRGIHPRRKTIMVFIAPPKAGKSWYLINQGKACLARRKSVLHLTCENSKELTAKRYVQAMYAMSTYEINNLRVPVFDRLEDGTVMPRLEARPDPLVVNEAQRKVLTTRLSGLVTRPRLLIKEFPSGTLTVPMIIAYMNMLVRVENFRPDLVIVDYPKQMKLGTKEYRLDLGRILIDLRGISSSHNCAMTTVMQGTRVSASAGTVTSGMIAEDYSVVGTADTIVTYSQTGEEKKIGTARILVDRAREAADSYMVMISQSYATGQFCLDSTFMSSFVKSEVDKLISGNAAQGDGGYNPLAGITDGGGHAEED